MIVQRAETYFAQDRPAYWRRQTQVGRARADRGEGPARLKAIDCSSRRSSSGDRGGQASQRRRATASAVRGEATRDCEAWALEVSQQCDGLLGPLADVVEHCEVLLPTAANELRAMIEQLRAYAEQAKAGG